MPAISVIIPVYNSEETVEACVESILNQTLADYEIILINDGSIDNSGELCKQFALLDFRVKYFELANGGLAAARNFGLSKAEGEYIAFVDSDDFLEEYALEFMLEKADSTNCDIVLCGYYRQCGKAFKEIKTENVSLNAHNINNYLAELKYKNLIDPVWNKLYRRSFIEKSGVLMPEGEIFEDTYFNLSLLPFNPKIEVFDACFYNYTSNFGSITRRYNPEKLETVKQRARLLRHVSGNIDEFCDYYYIKSVFSSLIDMFFSLEKEEILKNIKAETETAEFKAAANNANYGGLVNKGIIGLALSGNAGLIYAFCKVCYILKYNLRVII